MVILSRYLASELMMERGNVKYSTKATCSALNFELLHSCSDVQVGSWEQHQLCKPAECVCRDSLD